jgi:hypothetical protein
MRLIIGEAPGNGAAAVSLYTVRYYQRRLPKPLTFLDIDHRIKETGTTRPSTADCRRQNSSRTIDM